MSYTSSLSTSNIESKTSISTPRNSWYSSFVSISQAICLNSLKLGRRSIAEFSSYQPIYTGSLLSLSNAVKNESTSLIPSSVLGAITAILFNSELFNEWFANSWFLNSIDELSK